MALSCTSSQRRPFQGDCRRRSRLSTIQQRVRFFTLSFFHIDNLNIFSQLPPLQRGTRKQPPRISRSIPRSVPISITHNQTPSTTTWFPTNSELVASLIRRPGHQRGMLLRSTLPPPITGPTSTLMRSSPPLVHSLRRRSSSRPTFTSPDSPTPPRNPAC